MTGKGGIGTGETCPHCGRSLRSYKNPPRFVCETHGTIPGEQVLRPDPKEPFMQPEEKILKNKGRKYLK